MGQQHIVAMLSLRRLHTTRLLRRKVTSGDRSKDNLEKIFFSHAKDLEPEVEIKQLSQVRQDSDNRYYHRYFTPSKTWFTQNVSRTQSFKHFFNLDPQRSSDKYILPTLNERLYDKGSHTFYLSPSDLMNTPLKIGDLVLLRSNPTQLSMCVDLPTDIMDPRYTFASTDGSLQFAARTMILLRIPSCHKQELDGLVQLERKHSYEPIGVVKNSPMHTYVLPILARQLITSYVPFEITKKAWNQVPIVSKKLELLHRFLQRSTGPWQVSIFTLCELVQNLDLQRALSKQDGSLQDYMSSLFQKVGLDSNLYCLGEQNLHVNPPNKIDASYFLSTYWSLVKQQELQIWGGIQTHRGMLTPISVTVLPLNSEHLYYENVVSTLKQDNYRMLDEFAELVNKKNYKPIQNRFPQLIQILKNYAAGNFNNNGAMITLVSKIFRKLHTYKERDTTRDMCHELLTQISPDKLINPLLLNKDLGLPMASQRSALEQMVYDISKPPLTEEDSYVRHDFGDMPVYCIDSETAHEIDDGVSIETLSEKKYRLHIHIADPASSFAKSTDPEARDDVLDIAFQRSFTTYLPDMVLPMLPESYCRAADLGKDGNKTKTLSFSIDIYFHQGSLSLLDDTFKMRLGLVSRFPRVTYEKVDLLLQHPEKQPKEASDLKLMYEVAKSLRAKRVKNQDAIIFGEGFNKGLVKLSPDETGELTQISFEDQVESKSTVLVSEMMILANTLTGGYFRKNKIPGVFRCYNELQLKDRALKEYTKMKEMTKNGQFPTIKDINTISSLLNSSFYTGKPKKHEMIGASEYLTVTSPLRRFPDMINHLQIHRHLRGLPLCFSQQEVDGITWHIQSRDVVLKSAARMSATYWTLKFLKSELEKKKDIRFTVMVTSVPHMGTVSCAFPNLNAARGTLKLDPKHTPYPAIGDLIHKCKLTKLDCLDGVIELEISES